MNPSKIVSYTDKLKIYIFDDVFSYAERTYFYDFALNSQYCFSRTSTDFPEDTSNRFQLRSSFSKDDVKYFKFFNSPNIREIIEFFSLDKLYIQQARVNACLSSDVYNYHVDGINDNSISIIYNLNMKWDSDWEGDTKFADTDGIDTFFSSAFIPGRLIVFNSGIPHRSVTTSSKCPFARFTFNSILVPEKNNQNYSFQDIIGS